MAGKALWVLFLVLILIHVEIITCEWNSRIFKFAELTSELALKDFNIIASHNVSGVQSCVVQCATTTRCKHGLIRRLDIMSYLSTDQQLTCELVSNIQLGGHFVYLYKGKPGET